MRQGDFILRNSKDWKIFYCWHLNSDHMVFTFFLARPYDWLFFWDSIIETWGLKTVMKSSSFGFQIFWICIGSWVTFIACSRPPTTFLSSIHVGNFTIFLDSHYKTSTQWYFVTWLIFIENHCSIIVLLYFCSRREFQGPFFSETASSYEFN